MAARKTPHYRTSKRLNECKETSQTEYSTCRTGSRMSCYTGSNACRFGVKEHCSTHTSTVNDSNEIVCQWLHIFLAEFNSSVQHGEDENQINVT
jgi:hypothetical protein